MLFQEQFARDLAVENGWFMEIADKYVVFIWPAEPSRALDAQTQFAIRLYHHGENTTPGGVHLGPVFTADDVQELLGYDLTRYGGKLPYEGFRIAREVVEDIVIKLSRRVGITLERSAGGICMFCKLYDAYAEYSEKYGEVRCYRHCE